jgi:GNAT superfamily N-acetyltransferase
MALYCFQLDLPTVAMTVAVASLLLLRALMLKRFEAEEELREACTRYAVAMMPPKTWRYNGVLGVSRLTADAPLRLRERVAALVEDEWRGSGLRYLRGGHVGDSRVFFLWKRTDGLLATSIEVLGHVHLGEASSSVQAAHREIGIDRAGNVATVSGLVVAEKYRGQGLGASLMAAAELDVGGHFYLSAAGAAAVRFYLRSCSYYVLPPNKHLSCHFSTHVRTSERGAAAADIAAAACTWMHKFHEAAAAVNSESPTVPAANSLLAELHAERQARAKQPLRQRRFVGTDAETLVVNYHHIVPPGRPPPPGFDVRSVRVHDGRCEAHHTLDTTGFELVTGLLSPDLFAEMARATDVHEHIRNVVYPALAARLRMRHGSGITVIPFDHVLRRGEGPYTPRASSGLDRAAAVPPVGAVHNDYSVRSGYSRARMHLEAHASATGLEHALAQRFAIVNVWSPLATVKRDALGMVEWSTLHPRDVQCVVRRVSTVGVDGLGVRETYRGLYSHKHRSLLGFA